MSVKAIRLSELVEKGRGSMRPDPAAVSAPMLPAATVRAPYFQPEETRRSAAIVNGIELLAVQLLSLSKTRKDNPKALMIEALRSIDSCLVAIGRQS